MADLTAPPIRTALINNPDGSPFQQANGSQGQLSTEKSWYYYWNNAGRQINANTLTLSQLVTHGTHADRPDPSTVVDGALYVEHDRGVLYQNWNGSWRYIAGTMYGSLSPDQRPTDLGLADGGFEFRSVDSNTAYAPKHFVWSQTAWIDATQVLYGTHATRPAADYHTPARTIYVETDRGSVIYQQQANIWTYCGGSWSSVLSARPADLGAADTGFVFIATDTGQTFRWNGTAWVETTPIAGGSSLIHPNAVTKVGATPGQIVEGGITDLSAGNSGKVTILASGYVGLGTAAATAPLHVLDNAGNGIVIQRTATNPHKYNMLAGGSGQFCIYDETNGTYPISINASGNVGISVPTANATYQLQVNTDSAGKPGTSTWSVVSDLRLKQNVEPVKDDSLAILGKLDWIRYEYNGKANTPAGLKAIGLVAQKLRVQLPEAVRSTKTKLAETDSETVDVLAIDYHHIIVHSARAIAQLNAEVQALKALIGKP